jgi:hypothetical protein
VERCFTGVKVYPPRVVNKIPIQTELETLPFTRLQVSLADAYVRTFSKYHFLCWGINVIASGGKKIYVSVNNVRGRASGIHNLKGYNELSPFAQLRGESLGGCVANYNSWSILQNQRLGLYVPRFLRFRQLVAHNLHLRFNMHNAVLSRLRRAARFEALPADETGCDDSHDYKYPLRGAIPRWRLAVVVVIVGGSTIGSHRWGGRDWILLLCGVGYLTEVLFGLAPWGKRNSEGQHYCGDKGWFHFSKIVTQKLLTSDNYRNTLILMANVLNAEKQIAAISALAEEFSIRSIERMMGVHRDTIMRLGVKVGNGCAALMDAKMRNLPCTRL